MTRELLDLALQATALAYDLDLSHLHDRTAATRRYMSVFPGEHYKLLAALVKCLQPQLVVEIGTFTGLSALAMLTTLPGGGRIVTFDLVPWRRFIDTALRTEDFADGRLEQCLGNLAKEAYFHQNQDLLSDATLIFIDGPKDGRFEPTFFHRLLGLGRVQTAVIVCDDIRLWNMLKFWRGIDLPKLDLTSFGHWSGTGICSLSSR